MLIIVHVPKLVNYLAQCKQSKANLVVFPSTYTVCFFSSFTKKGMAPADNAHNHFIKLSNRVPAILSHDALYALLYGRVVGKC